jgi:hypothetical protein
MKPNSFEHEYANYLHIRCLVMSEALWYLGVRKEMIGYILQDKLRKY